MWEFLLEITANVIAVSKSPVFIDLAADTVLPNSKIAKKWEGLAIGLRLNNGARVIIAGNDNNYSVTQSGPSISRAVQNSATSTSRRG